MDVTTFAAERWAENEKLVSWTIWRIIKKYGGDYEELMSEALVIFMEKVVGRYRPEMGSFSNWTQFWIYKGLLETVRNRARHLNITGPVTELQTTIAQRRNGFEEMWSDFSPDTQRVLVLLFDLDLSEFKNKSLIRMFLRRQVRERHSLENERITECFREIEAALC